MFGRNFWLELPRNSFNGADDGSQTISGQSKIWRATMCNGRNDETLLIPKWVPSRVAAIAQVHLRFAPSNDAFRILNALTSNPQMQTLWSKLKSRHRSKEGLRSLMYPTVLRSEQLGDLFLSALRFYDSDSDAIILQYNELELQLIRKADSYATVVDDIDVQELAMARLFHVSYVKAVLYPPSLRTFVEENARAEELFRKAKACCDLSKHLGGDIFDDLGSRLIRHARILDEEGLALAENAPNQRSVSGRNPLRAFAMTLRQDMRMLFGQNLSGLSARIINCVFPEGYESAKSIDGICNNSTPHFKEAVFIP